MDLTLLAQALQQAEKESAASNPYNTINSVVDSVNWNPYNFSTTENVAGGAVKGLLSGLFGGLGQDYQANQSKQIYGSLDNIINGNLTKPDDMDLSVFAPLEKAGTLFGIQKAENAKEAAAQNEADYDKEVRKALLQRGQVLDPSGSRSMSIFDPVKDKEDEARLTAKAKILGENEAWGLGEGENPDSPQAKMKAKQTEGIDATRKEFNALQPVKDYEQASKAASALAKALKDNNAVTDQELVRYSILMIEPGMAVREGEAAAIANSQSIPAQLKGEALKALNGESTFDSRAREGIKNLARRAYEGHYKNYDKAFNYYQGVAKGKGLPEDQSISYLGKPITVDEIGLGSDSQQTADLGSFIRQAKASGLTKEQARAAWAAKGGK